MTQSAEVQATIPG